MDNTVSALDIPLCSEYALIIKRIIHWLFYSLRIFSPNMRRRRQITHLGKIWLLIIVMHTLSKFFLQMSQRFRFIPCTNII